MCCIFVGLYSLFKQRKDAENMKTPLTEGQQQQEHDPENPQGDKEQTSCMHQCNKIVDVEHILAMLSDWIVLILMLALPSFISSYAYVFLIAFCAGVLQLLINGYRYSREYIKIYPKLFDVGIVGINLGLMIFEFVYQPSNDWSSKWSEILTNAPLLVLILITFAIGKPFTVEFAKERAPKEKWTSPIFLGINYTVSVVWTIEMILSMVFSLLFIYVWKDAADFRFVPSLTLLTLAMTFTRFYPPYARAKALAEQEAMQQEMRRDTEVADCNLSM